MFRYDCSFSTPEIAAGCPPAAFWSYTGSGAITLAVASGQPCLNAWDVCDFCAGVCYRPVSQDDGAETRSGLRADPGAVPGASTLAA